MYHHLLSQVGPTLTSKYRIEPRDPPRILFSSPPGLIIKSDNETYPTRISIALLVGEASGRSWGFWYLQNWCFYRDQIELTNLPTSAFSSPLERLPPPRSQHLTEQHSTSHAFIYSFRLQKRGASRTKELPGLYTLQSLFFRAKKKVYSTSRILS